ncbi:Protocadherin-like protein [Lamellibrachia satsuma]|nr:Protocadherin-like protein [Lamellibrachia satsuma]
MLSNEACYDVVVIDEMRDFHVGTRGFIVAALVLLWNQLESVSGQIRRLCNVTNLDIIEGNLVIDKVTETLPVGTVVTTLAFGGTVSQIQLSVTRDNPYYGFDEKTRQLTVIQRIRLETKEDKKQRLEISCIIGYSSLRVPLLINVTDANDNAPRWRPLPPWHSFVSEYDKKDTRIEVKFEAYDVDPDTTNITYSLAPIPGDARMTSLRSHFKIPLSHVPEIFLENSIDFEQASQVMLLVKATDEHPGSFSLSSTGRLYVRVNDEDDLNPSFKETSYSAELECNVFPGSFVKFDEGELEAADDDLSLSPVYYSLDTKEEDNSDYFSINKETGKISVVKTVMPLAGTRVSLSVVATQRDNANRVGRTVATIDIKTLHPRSPVFTNVIVDVTVMENVPIGTIVKTAKADPKNPGSTLKYYFYNKAWQKHTVNIAEFIINPRSGVIKTSKPIDYEKTKKYDFIIVAKDGSYKSPLNLKISVININDNNPMFAEAFFQFSGTQHHSKIDVVGVTDKDGDTNYTFRILGAENVFSINEDGILSVDPTPADRVIDKPSYTMAIVVRDSGVPPREEICIVNVDFSKDTTKISGLETIVTSIFYVSISVVTFIDIVLFIYIMKM